MGDTFQHDFSDDEFEGEAEEKVATLTMHCIAMWPGPGSVPFEPRVLCFNKGPFVIGRFDTLQAASDTAYFKVPNVSRSHATLTFETGRFWVADNGSSNGT